MLQIRIPILAGLLLLTAACGEDAPTTTGPDPNPSDNPAVATTLVFDVSPSSGTAGMPFAPAVVVAFVDDQGTVVASASGTVSLQLINNTTGGTLTGTLSVNAVDGLATFDDLAVDRAATGYLLEAEAGGFPSASSTAFDVAPGPPAQLAFLTPPSDADLDAVLAPAVEVAVQDAFGNRVETATVDVTLAFHANPPGAVLTGTLTASIGAGVASFPDLRIDRAALGYTLIAEAAGLESDTSPPFDVMFALQHLSGSITLEEFLGLQEHTCGVTTGGTAYCWGANDYGQLGDGDTGTASDTPVRVRGDHAYARVAAGFGHTCGLTATGSTYCWGSNGVAQLGNGNAGTDSDTPVLVQGGHAFTQLVAGSLHSCGLTADRLARCWGNNDVGQLGNGAAGTDGPIPTLVLGGHKFARLTAGGAHTCGTTAAGVTHCWGYNEYGQLGDKNAGTFSDTPVQVAGGHTFGVVAAGGGHTCGVTIQDDAYCWGFNDSNQLGDGTGLMQTAPVLVQGGKAFAHLVAGGAHTCGLTKARITLCWGENAFGALGDGNAGTNTDVPSPVFGGRTFARLARGTFHTCAINTDRTAYCWGWNEFGQIGDGATGTDRDTPVAVANP
jgi:alpha-tubulin suppressor-like RCC1 family protein